MRILLSTLLFLLTQKIAQGQACREIELFSTTQKRNLIQEYINDCYQRHYFFEDKGVVQIIDYQDTKGRTCWLVSAYVDNRFLTAPPEQYSWLGNDLVLVYQGDKQGKALAVKNPSTDLSKCLSELAGGRVYAYSQQPQYAYYIDEKGVRKKIAVRHDVSGNVHNELIIIFNLDGTISKRMPV